MLDAAAVGPGLSAELFGLFSEYYADVAAEAFQADLRAKDFVVVLETAGRVAGFSTARLFPFDWQGERIDVLFSGDTIVARQFWGEQELARAWLRQVGRLARAAGGRRMVWFLICKGHRTYRYMPVFARAYVPAPEGPVDPGLVALRDAIATEMFGARFDPVSGTIRFAQPRGRLREEIAEPSGRELQLPEVAWFLAANPGYRNGDELACLCDLSPDNMRPRARRWFDEGWHDG